uniref:Signal recognition particle 19 kDa protein n=1 Tax=Arcella intermedia TaxID=1963864 RepID=A0A6B2LPZ0_9EUKA
MYPVYINAKRTVSEGRKITRKHAVDNPTIGEIGEVCKSLGLNVLIQPEKCHPRNAFDPYGGRVKVQLKNEAQELMNEQIPDRKTLMIKACALIPRLPSRLNPKIQPDLPAKPGKKGKKIDKNLLV